MHIDILISEKDIKLQTLKDSNELEIMKTGVKTQKPNYNGIELCGMLACVFSRFSRV